MFNRIKSAPRLVQVLFLMVIFLEVISFCTVRETAPLIRLFLLAALMFLTLGGSRVARFILAFFLFAGALYLVLLGSVSETVIGFKLIFHFLPAILLAATAVYLLFSKKFKMFLRKNPMHESQTQS